MTQHIFSFFLFSLLLTQFLNPVFGSDRTKPLETQITRWSHILENNQEELNLTDSQAKKLKTIEQRIRRSQIRAEAEKSIIMLDIQSELAKDKPNQNKINNLIDDFMEIKVIVFKDVAHGLIEIKQLLSINQEMQAAKLME